ncbi:extracellular solute-binding protein [Streptomyces sp. 3MP-14]|uniref:Extracellular solute-binding protein n=1 Tax=Streptomyces mimosae TaxID=2586635 RepID=A0A5N6A1S1_9ACTN|nr:MULTISPECIES: extracellular solute-binding protein [Streptomyces]KAB8161620.1 extracellular solute-binding protein [Streptomyces mimosae]KAB8173443.1 extracellular solute-binding protein [Streptomyces sp. 3MP-14]
MSNSPSAPSRRRFLASTAVAAAATAGGVPLLSACSSDGGGGGAEGGRVAESELESILPTYRASDIAVEPDIPAENGASPGYTRFIPEDELGVTVPEPRGSGGEFRAMTPLWGTPPPEGNDYWTAMDEAIGSRMVWQTQDGNTYGEKLGAVLAGSDIPDLVCVPGWELQGQIPRAISSRFADLGPYLSGDRVLDYPNLAAIPTAAWEPAIFGGALRGLPMPAPPIGGVIPFYRQDVFEAEGWDVPTDAEDFIAFCRDITSARNRVWACEDMKWSSLIIHGVLPDKPQYWEEVDGRLVNRYETDAYLEALDWTRRLFEAGVVHPDAVAAQGDALVRFTSGESLMFNQGQGVWHNTLTEQRAANPEFRMNAFDYFGVDGADPVLYAGNGSSIWTFVNKDLPEDRVREALEIANFCAAPYGTREHLLRTYGVQDVHYTVEGDQRIRTPQGEEEVVPETYTFIATPGHFIAAPDVPQLVEDWTGWMRRHMPFVKEAMFFGRQVQEPDQFTNLSDQFEDLEDDVVRGRRSISDLQDAVAEWRRNGGDGLRDWYQRLRDDESA